ncbi:hypothetical protein WH47_02369 [Habropoda laboriosa]|uniref:Mos1 transposase HTH domain-containing protein n=1 Tax=Habropoda laboriosa TaxID=597456 RepID=A0A0L7RK83_9HYME|nr:hypothetical protein WH47_02369 [Habropoda laboriosa]
MSEQSIHFRHLILFYIRKKKNVEEMRKKICDVYGEDAINKRTIQKWIKRFNSGDFNVENKKKWVPHELMEKNLHDRISIWRFIAKAVQRSPFFKHTNHFDTCGHSRKILTKLMNSEYNKRNTGKVNA